MTIFTFSLKRSVRSLLNLLLLGATPLFIIFLADEQWFMLPMGYQLYGVILLFIASKLVSIMLEDRTTGVLQRIGVSPITHFQYLWQNLLAFSVLLVAQCAVVVLGGVLYGLELPVPILLFTVYSLFAMTAISLSLAWFSLFRHKETAFSVFIFITLLVAMIGGLFWPVEVMPPFLQRLAMFFPTYWLAESLQIIQTGENMINLWLPLTLLLLFSSIFLVIGSKRRLV